MAGLSMARLRHMAVYRDKSETTGLLKTALGKAQAAFTEVKRDTEAEWGEFASLHSMIQATRPALTANGLACNGEYQTIDGQLYLVTVLEHGESGEWVSSVLPIKVSDDTDLTVAYMTRMRRVNYATILELAPENEKKSEQLLSAASAQAAAHNWKEQRALAANAIAAAATVDRVNSIVSTVKDKIAKQQMDPHDLASLEEAAARRINAIAKAIAEPRQAPPARRPSTKQEVPA